MNEPSVGRKIEHLGRKIADYDRKSMEAYARRDFASSMLYHEKALALERCVAESLKRRADFSSN